jgi:superfamily II DNA or RNA helicase
MELNERILNDAGGWQVMKQARGLHALGRIRDASWSDGLLTGIVREGETEFRAGLRIQSRTHIENLCTCRDSKVRSLICAHSVAVGLEVLKPSLKAQAPAPTLSTAETVQRNPGVKDFGDSTEGAGVREGSKHQISSAFSRSDGEPIELHVVLPPNFLQASARGAIPIGVEAVLRSRRVLLSAVAPNGKYCCDAFDWVLLQALGRVGSMAEGRPFPGMLMLNVDQVFEILAACESHPRLTVAKRTALRVVAEGLRPALFLEQHANGDLSLKSELPSGVGLILGKKAAWGHRDETIQPVCLGLPAVYLSLLSAPVKIPAAAVTEFLRREWTFFEHAFHCDDVRLPADSAMTVADPATIEVDGNRRDVTGDTQLEGHTSILERAHFFLGLEGSLNFLSGTLKVGYGDRLTTLSSRPGQRRGNRAAEDAALKQLHRAGFSGPDADGKMVLRGEIPILEFFARTLPALKREWTVDLGERFTHVTREIQRIEPKLEITASGENWFELDVAMQAAGGERFSGVEIQRLIQSGRSHLRRKDGSVAVFDPGLLDEFQQVLRDCEPEQRQAGRYRIANRQAGFLQGFIEAQGAAIEAPAHWRQWAMSTRNADSLKAIPLGDLDEQLRPYQKQGVYWMHFLAANGLGGILADEMGLGKTVQALAFLRTLNGRRLVVAPSSLLTNWQREAQKFCPTLRVLVISGASRHERMLSEFENADLVITSYPLLRRDIDWYRGEEFSAVVLDEGQHIKNPDSQIAKSVFMLRSKRRFVLTGTPLENSIRDVWSLFHFTMPGYLGTRLDFRERYELPITQQPGGNEYQRMARRVAPFVLRRTKRAVVKELPEKIEQVIWCELSPAQREAYGKLVDTTRREVSRAEELRNQGQARILMLTALLRLRQACNDLRLLGVDFAQEANATDDEAANEDGESTRVNGAESSSGKLAALGEIFEEAQQGGHRMLVFSQFSSMLDLLQQWMEARQIDFCRLDGSTRDRTAQVDRFQTGTVPVFLISLKAGGVGLNLTAADTVIHFDPWWNPAVEAQATDRAHRIGQTSVVTSYKLIMRGTVEEKILALQGRKKALMDALVDSEQPLMDGLSMEDLGELLA